MFAFFKLFDVRASYGGVTPLLFFRALCVNFIKIRDVSKAAKIHIC